jgi:hypothetical protein
VWIVKRIAAMVLVLAACGGDHVGREQDAPRTIPPAATVNPLPRAEGDTDRLDSIESWATTVDPLTGRIFR